MKRALRIDFVGPVDKPSELADGSVRVPALIAKSGVQVYTYDDGTTVREYRPAEEVFSPASMATWPGVSLTIGHPDEAVSPSNWARFSVGHIADNVRKDGVFIAADAVVKHGEALSKISNGEIVELSCGYFAEIDPTPGITEDGEEYDAIQRNIIGNHVAIGPAGWGRAGEKVKLYVDSKGVNGFATESRTAISYPAGEDLDVLKKDAITKKDEAKAEEPKAAPAAEEPKAAPAAEEPKAEEPKAAEEPAKPAEEPAKDSKESLRIRIAAVKHDSKHAAVADSDRTDREVMLAVVRDWQPTFNADGKSDDYVRAAFDLALTAAPAKRDDSKAATVLNEIVQTRTDGENDPLVKARNAMIESYKALNKRKGA